MDRMDYFKQKDVHSKLDIATFGTQQPVRLDVRHLLVCLFLQHQHERHFHHGVDYLRALTQQKLSILKLHTRLKSIQLKCVTCHKRKAQTFIPIMADLLRERVAFRSPFTNTGIDYFGLFYVSVKRPTEKRWRLFFT